VVVRVCRSLLVRVFQIAERVCVYLISGGHLLCFEFYLNSVFAFNEPPCRVKDVKGMKTHVFGDCVVLEGHDRVDMEFLE